MRLAWTGAPAHVRLAGTGWDTCLASLALNPLLALMVLLNAKFKFKSLFTFLVGHIINVWSIILQVTST